MTQTDLDAEVRKLVERSDSPVAGVQFEFPPIRDGVPAKVGPAGEGQESEKEFI